MGLPTLGVTAPIAANNVPVNLKLDAEDSVTLLSIHDIEAFGRNPRTRPNPTYQSTKADIQKNGITNILTVTKPPGATKYHPYGGGNTRLAIAKELYKEGDQRFASLYVVVKPWAGVTRVLAAHIGENENRSP